MTIGSAVNNAAETSGDLNKEAWDKYNALRSAVLDYHNTDGSHLSTGDVVLKALFDANTILAASTDDTPAALTVAASRIVGRASTGGIAALTASQVNNILGTVTKALDNLASVAINVSLISDTDDTDDLGSAAKEWKDLYIDGTANIDSLVADTADINAGTVDAITSLTAAGNLDIGAYNLRAASMTADGLTATRVIFAGTNGLLSDDSDMTFATDTLTVTKIGAFQAAGAINFDNQNMTNVDIDSGAIDGVTIGGAAAPTVTNLGTVTTCDINGGTIGGITFDGALTMSLGSDADGDIYYRASNVLTRLAKGTATHVLTMGASIPEWAAASGGVDTSGTPVDDDFAKFTDADTIEGRSYAEVLADLSLLDGWIAAGETWTYASADDPTFTFTIASFNATSKYSAGMKIKLTQTTVKYFIITAVTFDDPGSTITVYGGTDYDLANATITVPCFSLARAPLGFPLDSTKWSAETTDTAERTQASPTATTWYNLGTITLSIPIGHWKVSWKGCLGVIKSSTTEVNVNGTLSTANNSASDADFTSHVYLSGASANMNTMGSITVEKFLTLASKTSYYLNVMTTIANTTNIGIRGDLAKTIVRAVCAYL